MHDQLALMAAWIAGVDIGTGSSFLLICTMKKLNEFSDIRH